MSNAVYPLHLYGLVDCNSFFASCEKLFRPDLRDKAVDQTKRHRNRKSNRVTDLNFPEISPCQGQNNQTGHQQGQHFNGQKGRKQVPTVGRIHVFPNVHGWPVSVFGFRWKIKISNRSRLLFLRIIFRRVERIFRRADEEPITHTGNNGLYEIADCISQCVGKRLNCN